MLQYSTLKPQLLRILKELMQIPELNDFYLVGGSALAVKECIAAYKQKYPTEELLISIPYALTYFADADESEEPISLKGQTWATVKRDIQKKVSEYLK